MNAAIAPKQTVYNGRFFRSRLEARWAVFFDHLGWKFQYEPERYPVRQCSGEPYSSYLPDFHLTQFGSWVEVKGSLSNVDDGYLQLIADCVDWGGCLPGMCDSTGSTNGLMWLSDIPEENICNQGWPVHPILQHHEGGWINPFLFSSESIIVLDRSRDYFDSFAIPAPEIRKSLTWYGNLIDPERECPFQIRLAYRSARMARFE